MRWLRVGSGAAWGGYWAGLPDMQAPRDAEPARIEPPSEKAHSKS